MERPPLPPAPLSVQQHRLHRTSNVLALITLVAGAVASAVANAIFAAHLITLVLQCNYNNLLLVTKHICCNPGCIQAPLLSLVTKVTCIGCTEATSKHTSIHCRVYGLDDKAASPHDSFHLQASAKATQAAEALQQQQQQQQGSVVAKAGSQLSTSQGTGDKHSMFFGITFVVTVTVIM